jgi:hypothetical protein
LCYNKVKIQEKTEADLMAINHSGERTDVSRFSADYANGAVFIGGNAFSAGQFIVDLLNLDADTAALTRLGSHNIRKVLEQMDCGFIYVLDFNRARDELRELVTLAAKIPPFMHLDLGYETYRVEILTQDSTLEKLQRYLILRGKQAENCLLPGYNRVELTEEENRLMRDGEFILQDMCRTLRFYNHLGQDVFDVRAFGMMLIPAIDKLKKRDENALIELLQKFIPHGYSEFDSDDRCGLSRAANCNVEYVAARVPGAKKSVTARRMVFERLMDFVISDLFEGVAHGHYPRKCIICGRHFLRLDGRDQKYCDGLDPNDAKGRFCRQVAADRNRRERPTAKDHPIKHLYQTRISTINRYLLSGKYTLEIAENCKRLAKNRCNRTLSDKTYTLEQYTEEMKMSRIFADAAKGLNR